ncbi:MAG TPA: hypothetical protein VHB30_09405 [Solirubrobacteraceae bacterium]|jgi:hypothetical protein|nr:hypothetical protein [Solirubrobacteraceae bacterium]
MRLRTLRNVAIVAALAAIVAFVPEGGRASDFVGNAVSLVFTIVFLLLGVRLYQAHRMDLQVLGDRHRTILYGSLGLAVLAMAARSKLFDTGLGTFGWLVAMGVAAYGLYACWQHYRTYRL